METRHKPVLLGEILKICAPIQGIWLDGTFGAGGYARGLIEAGAAQIVAIDQDPMAHALAASWIGDWPIHLHQDRFSHMSSYAEAESLDGIVLDVGVSSMQIDEAERGFSFQKDGPLDMRMRQKGESAADIVNTRRESELADIFYRYGEERASRKIARAVVNRRQIQDFTTTRDLAALCERILPRPKPHEPHPATRVFQALRIAVNDELAELERTLKLAPALLKPGGYLAVVSFHSLEDRLVKTSFLDFSGKMPRLNRHQPAPARLVAGAPFELLSKKPIIADDSELADNPRARSAKLRVMRKIQR